MSWSDAIAAVFGTVKKTMDRLWGTQTREMDILEAQADAVAQKKWAALAATPPDLVTVNRCDRELRRLHNEIAAKRG